MQPGQPEMESVSPAHRSHADMTQSCYVMKNAFKSMLRLSIAAVLTLSGVLAFAPEILISCLVFQHLLEHLERKHKMEVSKLSLVIKKLFKFCKF